jgi:hypothetical protein
MEIRPYRAYSPADLAAEWQCSEKHVRNLLNSGQLRGWKLGGNYGGSGQTPSRNMSSAKPPQRQMRARKAAPH